MSTDNYKVISKTFKNEVFLPEVVALIEQGHTITLPLKGRSMRPFLEDGRDKALLSKPINTQVGDVVLAETYPHHFVLHRIVKIEGDQVTLRGDGNLGTEHCTLNDVKAFAIGFYRKGSDKLEKTNTLKWHIYSALWCRLLPIRRYLLALWDWPTLPAKIIKRIRR